MAVPSPLGSRLTVAALLALTAVTGFVDAVSYLRLGHVFVADMTGNVGFLGFTADVADRRLQDDEPLTRHSGLSLTASLTAIGEFVVGAWAGGRVANTLATARPGRWLSIAFIAEAVILGAVAVLTATTVLGHAGAAVGAAALQWSPTAVIALAATLAGAVGGVFTFGPRFRVSGGETAATSQR